MWLTSSGRCHTFRGGEARSGKVLGFGFSGAGHRGSAITSAGQRRIDAETLSVTRWLFEICTPNLPYHLTQQPQPDRQPRNIPSRGCVLAHQLVPNARRLCLQLVRVGFHLPPEQPRRLGWGILQVALSAGIFEGYDGHVLIYFL